MFELNVDASIYASHRAMQLPQRESGKPKILRRLKDENFPVSEVSLVTSQGIALLAKETQEYDHNTTQERRLTKSPAENNTDRTPQLDSHLYSLYRSNSPIRRARGERECFEHSF